MSSETIKKCAESRRKSLSRIKLMRLPMQTTQGAAVFDNENIRKTETLKIESAICIDRSVENVNKN